MMQQAKAMLFDATIAKLDLAGQALDYVAMTDLMSADVIVRSPITQLIRFEGIDQAKELFEQVFRYITDIRFYKVVGGGTDEQVIFWRGLVDGVYLEEANLLKLNDKGQICEMTVFMRAVPGLLALAAALAPSLARRRGWLRWLFVAVQLKLISAIYRFAEPMVIKATKVGVPVR